MAKNYVPPHLRRSEPRPNGWLTKEEKKQLKPKPESDTPAEDNTTVRPKQLPAPMAETRKPLQPSNKQVQGKQPSGWLTQEEKKAMRGQSPQSSTSQNDVEPEDNWDYNNVTNLVDWEGNWLPAPVEWEGRRGYKRDHFYESVADWVDVANLFSLVKMNYNAPKKAIDVTHKNFISTGDKEVAPHEWIPDMVDNQPLQTYWRNLLQSDLEPIEEEDIKLQPFWLRYTGHKADFQNPLTVPNASLDPADEEVEFGMYRKGKSNQSTSAAATKTYNKKTDMGEEARKRMEQAERRRTRGARREPIILPPPDPNRPKVNIYLRPANLVDHYQITNIYNHYVLNTVTATEISARTVQQMTNRIVENRRAELPTIVAVEKSAKKNKAAALNSLPTPHSTQEKVIGFAYAEDHDCKSSMLRFVAEVETFVHPEYLNKGVGKSLLDRLVWLLDPQCTAKHAVEWRTDQDDLDHNYPGGRRRIAIIAAHVYFDCADRVRITWIDRWLTSMGFEKKAEFEGWGYKKCCLATKAVFQYKTGANIDPKTVVDNTPL